MKNPFKNPENSFVAETVARTFNITVGKHFFEGGENGLVKFVRRVGIIVVAVIGVCLRPPPWFGAVKSSHLSIRKLTVGAVPALARPGLPSVLFFLVGLQARSRASTPRREVH